MAICTSIPRRCWHAIVFTICVLILIGLAFLVRQMYPTHPIQIGHASFAVRMLNRVMGDRYQWPSGWMDGNLLDFGDPESWSFGRTSLCSRGGPFERHVIGFNETIRTIPSLCLLAPTSAHRIAGIYFVPFGTNQILTAKERSDGRHAFIAWLENAAANNEPVLRGNDPQLLAKVKRLHVDETIPFLSGYYINAAGIVILLVMLSSLPGTVLWSWHTCMLAYAKLHRRTRRERLGLCTSCGYNMRGLPSDVCLECGKSKNKQAMST
ncbi:MAG: hypothetical protein H6815_07130 [Phycisphaeraceae bacterium]|nr:hypothetical protein [Phycisphaerales bacterium]MCB9860213.1 hypothetical protein [Phycisphaeraceae bacterium]